jgi:signal transduction histidine kinase
VVLVHFWMQLIRSEYQGESRAAADTVAALGRVLGSLGPESSTRDVLATALREVMGVTGVRTIVAALEHGATGRLLHITVSTGAGREVVVRIRRIPRAHRPIYFFAAREAPADFRNAHPCRRASVVGFTARDHWAGRLFLLDPPVRGPASRPEFETLVQQCICALAATRDLPRIRRRAAAHERARLGRELHDGVVQELATLDVELELLRRPAREVSDVLDDCLAGVQARLRAQVRDLRQVEEHARAYEVSGARLPAMLADIVERFRGDSGIDATFAAHVRDVDLPPRVCGEIVRIVQEALVNVRRHSGARHVGVEFACEDAAWKLWIEDDGRGLRAWGTASSIASGAPAVRPPAVIEERVQSIGGTLRLAPAGAGAGTRLEIAVARGGPWVSRTFESC